VPAASDPRLLAEAVRAAEAADVVVAVVGDRIELVGEGRSTATLELIGAERPARRADRDRDARGRGAAGVEAARAARLAAKAAAVIWAANPGMREGARSPSSSPARSSHQGRCRSRSRGTSVSSRPTTTRSAGSTARGTPT
jgi:beta-glucosidase